MTIQEFISDVKARNISDVIFDFDETLCTLDLDWGKWADQMLEVLKKYNPEHSNAYSQTELNDATRKLGKEFRTVIVKENAKAEKANYKGYSKNELALELLKQLRKVCRVHLWTSNDLRTVGPILIELGIANYFAASVFSGDVMFLKPDPDGFEKINMMKLPPEKFLFVGDSAADRGACEAVGIQYIDVRDLQE